MAKKKPDAKRRQSFDAALKSFCEKFNTLARVRSRGRVFRDFLELSAIALVNPIDKSRYDVREARYLHIIRGSYMNGNDRFLLPEMLADVIDMCSFGIKDVFGEIWMKLELRSDNSLNQVWTPFHVGSLMARLTMGDAQKVIDEKGFITLMEPASGTGVLVLAAADYLDSQGINYQQKLHVRAVDLDPMCVHMTFVHCTLYGIPAVIYQGNSISMEMTDTWITVMHKMGQWDLRFAIRDSLELLKKVDENTVDIQAKWAASDISARTALLDKAGIDDPEALLDRRPPLEVAELLRPPQAAE